MMHRALWIVVVAACADSPAVEPLARTEAPTRYGVVEIPSSLGGTNSRGNAIAGDTIAGFSNLADNSARHATLWRSGSLVDLGTLGGPNSNVAWPGLNDRGM